MQWKLEEAEFKLLMRFALDVNLIGWCVTKLDFRHKHRRLTIFTAKRRQFQATRRRQYKELTTFKSNVTPLLSDATPPIHNATMVQGDVTLSSNEAPLGLNVAA